MGGKWLLPVVFIWASLITNDTEYLFTCILAIFISSSRNSLSWPFAHFFPHGYLSCVISSLYVPIFILFLPHMSEYFFPVCCLPFSLVLWSPLLSCYYWAWKWNLQTGVTTGLSEDTKSFPRFSFSRLACTLMEALSSLLRLLVCIYVDCLACNLENKGFNHSFLCLPWGPAQSLMYCKYGTETELWLPLKAERLDPKCDFT